MFERSPEIMGGGHGGDDADPSARTSDVRRPMTGSASVGAQLQRPLDSVEGRISRQSTPDGSGVLSPAYVFYRGLDDHLWWGQLEASGAWTRHRFDRGRISAFGPSATRWSDRRIAVFQAGAQRNLVWRCWQTGGGDASRACERISTIGGRLNSAPSATLVNPELGAVFYAGQEGLLTCRWWRENRWGPVETVGHRSVEEHTSPVVVSNGQGHLAVFFLSRVRRTEFPVLFWRRWSDSAGWSDDEIVTGVGHLTRRPAATVADDGRGALFYWRPGIGLEPQGLFWRFWNRNGGWSDEHGRAGEILDTSPTAVADSENSWRLFYAGSRRRLLCTVLDRSGECRTVAELDTSLVGDPSACLVTDGASVPRVP